jgi:hypothetical protein
MMYPVRQLGEAHELRFISVGDKGHDLAPKDQQSVCTVDHRIERKDR